MKTILKSLSLMTVAACAGMNFVSCTADKDMYDQKVVEEITKNTYEENFMQKLGNKINMSEQEWDLADTYTSHLTPMNMKSRTTRATFTPKVTESQDYFYLAAETRQWLDVNLKEKVDNRDGKQGFVLSMPSNSFTIVPIYIGEAAYTWKLDLIVVDDQTGEEMDPIKIWEKGENVQISNDGENWSTLGTGRYETTIKSPYVRSKQYTVDKIPAGNDMKMLLRITTDKGVTYTSLDEAMVMLNDCPVPNLEPMEDGTPRKAFIIGCEDQYDKNSDWDLNDVVFMVYGNPNVPGDKRVEEYYQRAHKRYLMEDLGATDDFDFNDIVVDAFAERMIKKTYVDDVLVDTEIGEWTNEFANLKHLGGILPYSIKIGNTVLPWTEAALDVDKDEYSEIEGWNPRENNIELTVEGRGKNGEVFTRKIKFPKKGEVPMIIAVRPSQNWMAERQIIPSDWFTE